MSFNQHIKYGKKMVRNILYLKGLLKYLEHVQNSNLLKHIPYLIFCVYLLKKRLPSHKGKLGRYT